MGAVAGLPPTPMLATPEENETGDFWLATGMELYHVSTDRFELRYTSSAEYRILAPASDGGGLQRLREKRVTVHSTETGLNSNDAISVLQDREGRVWAGTFGGGISVNSDGLWESFSLPIEAPFKPNIASLCQTRNGTILMGGFEGPHFRWSAGSLEEVALLEGDAIRVIFEDRDEGLWIGSETKGQAFRKGDLEIRYDTSNGLSRNQVTAIAQDASGVIWAGTRHGLNRISRETVTTFYQTDGLGADGVYSLWRDAEDTLWIGTMGGGLSRFKDGRFATVTEKRGLLSDVIGQIIDDDLGDLWLGTPVGIMRARKQDLHDVLDGKTDYVSCKFLRKQDGLENAECAGGFQPACMKASDGTLWFCTIGGVVSIDPRSISRNKVAPPVRIEKVVMDEREVIPVPAAPRAYPLTTENGGSKPEGLRYAADMEPVIVPAGTARIELHYTGLSLVAPERVRFQFILEGRFLLPISDNGRGFDSARPAVGHGLAGLRKRAEQLAAQLKIDSVPGQGTVVTLEVRST